MGPEGGVLSSMTVPLVQASFPEGALTKKIRVGLQVDHGPNEYIFPLYMKILKYFLLSQLIFRDYTLFKIKVLYWHL